MAGEHVGRDASRSALFFTMRATTWSVCAIGHHRPVSEGAENRPKAARLRIEEARLTAPTPPAGDRSRRAPIRSLQKRPDQHRGDGKDLAERTAAQIISRHGLVS